MNKSYEQILKDKGVISKQWWEEYVEAINKGVVVDEIHK